MQLTQLKSVAISIKHTNHATTSSSLLRMIQGHKLKLRIKNRGENIYTGCTLWRESFGSFKVERGEKK